MEQDLDLEERNSDSGMNTTSGEQVEAAAAAGGGGGGGGGGGEEGKEPEKEEEKEENVAVAYDDIEQFQESTGEEDDEEGQDDDYEEDHFEDDFEEVEGVQEEEQEEEQNKFGAEEGKGRRETEVTDTSKEAEVEAEDVAKAEQRNEAEKKESYQEEVGASGKALETEAESNEPSGSIGTSPMQFGEEEEEGEGPPSFEPKPDEDEESEVALSEETKALTEMTFKPPAAVMDAMESQTKEQDQSDQSETEPPQVTRREASPQAQAQAVVEGATRQQQQQERPIFRDEKLEEVVAVTSNPIASLLEEEGKEKMVDQEREQFVEEVKPAEASVSVVEQYQQYEQYQAGLELERQLEKLDQQRKTSMEHISRDLFNATSSKDPSVSFQGSGSAGEGDLGANVDTSYVAVPTVERVRIPEKGVQQQQQQQWMPEVKENILETDLDKDLRNRLNMTEIEREQYNEKEVLSELQNTRRKKLGKIANTRTYLEGSVVPVLREAMKELARKRPEDPFDYLIEYLQRNKPSRR